jgi:hypothetical protein
VAGVAVSVPAATKTRAQHANTIRSKDAKRIAFAEQWKKYLSGEGTMTLEELDARLGIPTPVRPVWLGRAGEMGEA